MKKQMVVIGAGESGIGAALLGTKNNYDVFVSDSGMITVPYKLELENGGLEYEEQIQSVERILKADIIIKSPGVPDDNELIKMIRSKDIELISEIEFAYRYKGKSKIIAITGSNGKSTTTALIYHICKMAGLNCAMVGNIGFSFARQVATDPKELYVIEVSSFQLDDIKKFKPNVSIILNITEDHLDRYEYNFGNYIHSKFRITENQDEGDVLIYNMDDEVITEHINNFPIKTNKLPFTMSKPLPQGAYVMNNHVYLKWKLEETIMSVDDFTLKGKHNQYNTMAAGLAALVTGIRDEYIRESVKSFTGLEHRMEHVADIRGVEFINDSKATNVNSTWYALENMSKPVILIMGGIDKGNDYSTIRELIKQKVKGIICMGTDNRKLHEAFGHDVELLVNTSNAVDAVQSAFHFANKGDVVLLSPACASFDLFKNYEDRGQQFKEAVKNL